jgi:hypothetical protein
LIAALARLAVRSGRAKDIEIIVLVGAENGVVVVTPQKQAQRVPINCGTREELHAIPAACPVCGAFLASLP